MAGQQTLLQVWLLGSNPLQAEDFPNLSVSKELEEAGETPDSSVSSVGAKISMIPLSDGNKTGEELLGDRSLSANAKSVIRLDVGCITDEVPTQGEMENILPSFTSLYPNNFQMTWKNKLFQKLP